MTIEWSVSVGNILTIILTLGGFGVASIGFIYALKSSIEMTSERLWQLSNRMVNVENELKEMTKVIAVMAVQDQRMSGHTQRMDQMDRASLEFREWVQRRFEALERGAR